MSICDIYGVECQCLDCRPVDGVCTDDPCSVCDGPVSGCNPGESLEDAPQEANESQATDA